MAREQHPGEPGGNRAPDAGRPPGSSRIRTPRRRSDDSIREDILNLLAENPDLDATNIDIHVEGGDVTLSGAVDNRDAKWMAEDLAGSISGVREIHNRIKVARN